MRALARWGMLPLLAAPLGAWALGIGNIELESALNQPFKAQIPLTATPEELQGLKVAIAPLETFQRQGLDRPAFLSGFDLKVGKDSGGRNVISITSQASVAEPFVTMLIEVTTPRQRSVREFTVLLDPPVLLPAPSTPAVRPAETRPPQPSSTVAGGAITRPAPPPAAPPAPAPQPVAPPSVTSANATPPPSPPSQPAAAPPAPAEPSAAPRPAPASTSEGSYGPVQRAETLWAIAQRFKPDGATMNQTMLAVFQANPKAFGANMNLLHIGAVLRIPSSSEILSLSTREATAEVRRQDDEWRNARPGRLVLVPPAQPAEAPAAAEPAESAAAPVPAPAPEAEAPSATPSPSPAAPAAEPSSTQPPKRLVDVQSPALQNLEQSASQSAAAETPPPAQTAPGVAVQPEQVFTDETQPKPPQEETPAETPPAAATAPPAAATAPTPAPTPAPAAAAPAKAGPSLVDQVLGWAANPMLWIGLGVAALLLTALWFVRRRRQVPEDVTGRWEALEAEVDDDDVREATERMRRQTPEESIVVEEEATTPPARPKRGASAEETSRPERRPAPAAAPISADDTLSTQTVINLDQADPVAEADFHMAYGLYDQAAELISKALETAPNRRDLKLKLLEVYFVWGNKEAFLNAAKELRKDLGSGPDADWDKVVIMGKQICPDERLFTEATTAGASVDVDLEAGESPLDLAFDDGTAGVDLDLGGEDADADLELEATGSRAIPAQPAAPSRAKSPPQDEQFTDSDFSLDIGERTAAGLEAALFMEEYDDKRAETSPDAADLIDSLAVTQESPTIETPQSRTGSDMGTLDFSSEAPTVETPTIEQTGLHASTLETAPSEAPTVETPTIETAFNEGATLETPFGGESHTVEEPGGLGALVSDRTAEIDLDDLGLDVKDLEELPEDLGELPSAAGADSDTSEQPTIDVEEEDDLLSATGVTHVLRGEEDEDEADELEQRETAVLEDDDATMLAPGFDHGTLTGTEVLEHRQEFDDESGDTSLVKQIPGDKGGLDLNLDDFSQALHGAETVEQPRTSSFSHDVFDGDDGTPLDLDVGSDVLGSDDPTGTEDVSPLDPQTMTEVGTKLDLARAYIDMGDPEGARSILEEVLDEGDSTQRREAQSLIDVLSA